MEIADPVVERNQSLKSLQTEAGTHQWLGKILPLTLLALLLVISFVTVFVQADQYGITVDEPGENAYGQLVWSWYDTLGRDTRFLTANTKTSIQDHGAIFDVVVTEAQHLFGGGWHTRAVVGGLAGVVGVIAIALCGFELGGWWGALLAALSLWLYPRFFGAIFNNSKDIPFTSAMALVLWSVLLLIRHWSIKRRYLLLCLLVGFFIGLATAVRVVAIIWYPILTLLVAGWWLHSGIRAYRQQEVRANLVKQTSAAAIIVVVSLLTMIALWPYVAVAPLHNLYEAIMVMREYPYHGLEPFAGRNYQAYNLPMSYVPVWLVIGSPPADVLFAAIGGLVACTIPITHKKIDPKVALICLALLVPLATIIGLRATLYDGLRQFLFVIPPLLLLAVYGFMKLFTYLVRKRWTIALVGLTLLALVAQLQVLNDKYNLHPYEYMYFSPLIGGVPGANGRYDMDYWGVCNKPSAEWLAHNYQQYTRSASPTVVASFSSELVLPYLPGVFKAGDSNPDFFISVVRPTLPDLFPSYTVIHSEGIEGNVQCVVKTKPSLAQGAVNNEVANSHQLAWLARRH